jgi:two-component system CheB/CheR fusion protein
LNNISFTIVIDNTTMPEKKVKPIKKMPLEINARTSGTARQTKNKSFPIVGIGGSAGSLASFEKFFTHMPVDSGMAFVVIMHLHPDHNSSLANIIQQYTAMPVMEAADNTQIAPDKVYLIPPNKDMGIHNRKLLLLNPSKPHGYSQPIDYFLQSLADDQWNRAIAIIFSGMGSDGETGVRMVKEKLGLAMVEHPETAQYNSMPLASIGTNLVDFVLAPDEMPIKLIQYLNHPILAEETTDQAKLIIQNSTSIQKILMLLRSHTGHDFTLYKKSTITRRIDRRIAYHQLPDYLHYVNFLRENPKEIDILFNELLIGVTKFFRDAPAFDSLKNKLADLIQHKHADEPVRIWIAGCSTGEEAYSIAILLMECLETLRRKKLPKIQIFATDLDPEAIEHARVGSYHDNIVADVSPERLEKFFVKKDNHYTVKKDLREMIVFAQHNLIKDAPFTRLDLISCRNVMIYLTAELQKKIIPIFHYSLNAKGIMFMGPAETIGGFTELFAATDPKWKLFQSKEGGPALAKMIDFPFNVAKQSAIINRHEDNERSVNKTSLAGTFNKILIDNFTPSSVLINDKGDILYSNGKTGKYLELPSGEAIMNIHKMAREELRYVLGNVIHQARTQKGMATINDIKVKADDQVWLLNLKAEVLQEPGLKDMVLVIFEDKGMVKKTGRAGKTADNKNQAAQELEKELVYTKQQLNSTIEQMETSLEELKSTNEELQSTNEELQSTNEESLTTKEEMQSLNEELMTINMQYQSKADELTRLNNDMKNLLDATEIGTIFLDNNLDILRYTPQVRKLFNLIPTDIGRPIVHVVSNFDYPGIETDIREVIDTLSIKEIEVKTKTGDWYKVRVMPYRTLDNFISGAVLTFTLITHYKQLEYKFNTMLDHSTSLIHIMNEAALLIDNELKIFAANNAFIKLMGLKEKQIIGFDFLELLGKFIKTQSALKPLTQYLKTQSVKSKSYKLTDKGGKLLELTVSPFINEGLDTPLFIIALLKET